MNWYMNKRVIWIIIVSIKERPSSVQNDCYNLLLPNNVKKNL